MKASKSGRPKKFGDRLRTAMAGMTQDELAAKAGVPQATISRILRGSDPRLSTVQALERVLPLLGARHTPEQSIEARCAS